MGSGFFLFFDDDLFFKLSGLAAMGDKLAQNLGHGIVGRFLVLKLLAVEDRQRLVRLRVLEGFGHVCMIQDDFDLLEHLDPWLGTSR